MGNILYSSDKFQLGIEFVSVRNSAIRSGEFLLPEPDYAKMIFIFRGTAIFSCAGGRSRVGKCDVLIVYPGMSFFFDEIDDLEFFYFFYNPGKLPPLLATAKLPLVKYLFPDNGEYPKQDCYLPRAHADSEDMSMIYGIIRRLRYETRRRRLGHSSLVAAEFAEVIIYISRAQYINAQEHEPHWSLKKAVDFIHDNYRKKIAAAKLARTAGISERNLYRYFQESFGMTPADYITKTRLRHGVDMLHDELPVYEIAVRCGFCDSNHFCKEFKREFGVTPGKFRRTRLEFDME